MLYPGNPTKSLIIELLAEKAFLTAKEIRYEIGKYMGRRFSFQEIYRTLYSMITEGILVKYKQNYTLSFEHIEAIKKLSSKISDNIKLIHKCKNNIKKLSKDNKKSCLSFVEYVRYLNELIYSCFLDNREGRLYGFIYHHGTLFLPANPYLDTCKKYNHKAHVNICGKSNLDVVSKKMYEEYGNTAKLVEDNFLDGKNTEYWVANGHVIRIGFSQKYINKYDKLISQCQKQKLSKQCMEFMKNKDHQSKINITIEKNKEKAKRLISKMQLLK